MLANILAIGPTVKSGDSADVKIARIRDEDRMGPRRPEWWTTDDWRQGSIWYGLEISAEVPMSGVIRVYEWTGSDPAHRQNILHRGTCPSAPDDEALESIEAWEAFRRLQTARELSQGGYFRRDLFCELCMTTPRGERRDAGG